MRTAYKFAFVLGVSGAMVAPVSAQLPQTFGDVPGKGYAAQPLVQGVAPTSFSSLTVLPRAKEVLPIVNKAVTWKKQVPSLPPLSSLRTLPVAPTRPFTPYRMPILPPRTIPIPTLRRGMRDLVYRGEPIQMYHPLWTPNGMPGVPLNGVMPPPLGSPRLYLLQQKPIVIMRPQIITFLPSPLPYTSLSSGSVAGAGTR